MISRFVRTLRRWPRAAAFAFACALAAGCGDYPMVADASGAVDLNSPKCPAEKPLAVACEISGTIMCSYSGSECVCDGAWVCRSAMCPPRQNASGDCPRALSCDYGFGDVCTCVAPENVWRCCLGPCAVDGGAGD